MCEIVHHGSFYRREDFEVAKKMRLDIGMDNQNMILYDVTVDNMYINVHVAKYTELTNIVWSKKKEE